MVQLPDFNIGGGFDFNLPQNPGMTVAGNQPCSLEFTTLIGNWNPCSFEF